jgi:colicin import membrane protein
MATEPVVPPAADATALGGATPPAAEVKPPETALAPDAAKVAADKAAADKVTADAKAKTEADAKAAAAKFEVKLPEGIKLEDLGALEPLAKEVGLDSAKAQKVVDHFLKLNADIQAKQVAAQDAVHAEWKKALKSDKDFGGAAFDASRANALKAVSKYGDAELNTFLSSNAVGDHPGLFRMLARIGKAMAEDSVAGTSSNGVKPPEPKTLAQRFYPGMPSKES